MKTRNKILAGVLGVAVLAVAGFLVWFYLIKSDPPARLSTADLDEVVSATSAPAPTAPTDGASNTVADPAASTTAGAEPGPGGVDGTWTASPDSTLGYRVKEVLAGLDTEGVGRTNQVTGSLTIEGTQVTAADFTVDVASIESDEDRRDNQFRGQIMETDTFPTATFVLTAPIELGSVPADGETITATATGELTMHGVTNAVTFEVQAQIEGERIGVLGNIAILFADYGIDNPSNAVATVGDDGLLEFVLAFDRG
jgi:polyisoprenoid-binding protein YceI